MRMLNQLSLVGYKRPVVCDASPTGRGGNQAGLVVAARVPNHFVPVESEILAQVDPAGDNSRRWAAGLLRLKGLAVLCVCVYLFVGEGLSQRNLEVLVQVELLLRLVAAPALVAGDFNCLLGDLEKSQWPSRCGLVACRTNDNATVHVPGGRSIDHAFVSVGAVALAQSVEEQVFAWRPHVGLWCQLSRRPCA